MAVYRKLLPALALVFFTHPALSADKGLTYSFKKDSFHLTKACLAGISAGRSEIPNSYVLHVALKDSDACAKTLTRAISENIGSDLSIYFKSQLLITSRIVSGIKTEKGFRMTLADEKLVNDIVAFYR